jgi:hypothetical protein
MRKAISVPVFIKIEAIKAIGAAAVAHCASRSGWRSCVESSTEAVSETDLAADGATTHGCVLTAIRRLLRAAKVKESEAG